MYILSSQVLLVNAVLKVFVKSPCAIEAKCSNSSIYCQLPQVNWLDQAIVNVYCQHRQVNAVLKVFVKSCGAIKVIVSVCCQLRQVN